MTKEAAYVIWRKEHPEIPMRVHTAFAAGWDARDLQVQAAYEEGVAAEKARILRELDKLELRP